MVVPFVIDRHAHGLSYQWIAREHAVRAPHFWPADIANLDLRIAGHLRGLRLSGKQGFLTCFEMLPEIGQELFFAAALVALDAGEPAWWHEVLDTLSDEPDDIRPVVSALAWLPYSTVKTQIADLLASSNVDRQQLGFTAEVLHRRDPGHYLLNALESEIDEYRARALKAIVELGRTDLREVLVGYFSESEVCRYRSAWSGALFQHRPSVDGLRDLAESDSVFAGRAARTAARCMTPSEVDQWGRTLMRSNRSRIAFEVAQAGGCPSLIDHCLLGLEDERLARKVGEVFTHVLGIDLAAEELDAPPGKISVELSEDDEMTLDVDEDLSWPNPEAVKAWWRRHKRDFPSDRRLLAGQPAESATLNALLTSAPQRVREAAAELRLMASPQDGLVDVRARLRTSIL